MKIYQLSKNSKTIDTCEAKNFNEAKEIFESRGFVGCYNIVQSTFMSCEVLLTTPKNQKEVHVLKIDPLYKDKKIIEIAKHYQFDKQCDQAVEECSELIQAIQKNKRNGSGNITEEIADVKIMIAQLEFLLGDGKRKEINRLINQKLERQLERIKSGE